MYPLPQAGHARPPHALHWWRLQQDNGSIGQNFVNAFSTVEAIYGLTNQPIFLSPRLRTERALTWLAEQQNSDGGWGFFGSSDAGQTLDATFGYVAAGYDPTSLEAGDTSPLEYLEGVAYDYTRDQEGRIFPAQTGKLIVGVVASGSDPAAFGQVPTDTTTLSLVDDLASTYNAATGAYSTTAQEGFSSGAASAVAQSFAILGLLAAGTDIPADALAYLASLQADTGAWGGVDTTGLALQAFALASTRDIYNVYGVYETNIERGIAYLRQQQGSNGGWGNANSTAYALQGLRAVGEDLTVTGGRSALGALADFQKPDGPYAFAWDSPFLSPDDNGFATIQAVPALLGVSYPYSVGVALRDFTTTARGNDPDRLVLVPPTYTQMGQQVAITAPFGSDLNSTTIATATLVLNTASISVGTGLVQSTQIISGLVRGDGAFTQVVDLDASETLESVSIQYTERDPVQLPDGSISTRGGVTLQATPANDTTTRVYLPLVIRQ
ncbi:MAG: terpene cyclase/mutase family protein [Chloroflexaceae bacterium]|nr:terpene cyclase/mutase family protein [Chloroflexaceae bacterium]